MAASITRVVVSIDFLLECRRWCCLTLRLFDDRSVEHDEDDERSEQRESGNGHLMFLLEYRLQGGFLMAQCATAGSAGTAYVGGTGDGVSAAADPPRNSRTPTPQPWAARKFMKRR